jgi:hypothetical protein
MSVALNVIEQHQRTTVFRSKRNKILQELVDRETKSIRLIYAMCNHGRRVGVIRPLPHFWSVEKLVSRSP